MVFEHEKDYESQWAAICSIADKFGCTTESLRRWVRQSEIDQGRRHGINSNERARLRELREANEILRKASASFAQAELDRRKK